MLLLLPLIFSSICHSLNTLSSSNPPSKFSFLPLFPHYILSCPLLSFLIWSILLPLLRTQSGCEGRCQPAPSCSSYLCPSLIRLHMQLHEFSHHHHPSSGQFSSSSLHIHLTKVLLSLLPATAGPPHCLLVSPGLVGGRVVMVGGGLLISRRLKVWRYLGLDDVTISNISQARLLCTECSGRHSVVLVLEQGVDLQSIGRMIHKSVKK